MNMISILPVDINDIPCVPIEIFQEEILNAIEKKTGERPTIKELQRMDIGDIERILKIKTTRPARTGRNSPSSLYKFRSPESVVYNRAVINGLLLMKEN